MKRWKAEKTPQPCRARRYMGGLEAKRRRRTRIIRTIVGFGLVAPMSLAMPVMLRR